MALFTGEPRTANVVAVEETEVLEIGHDAMKKVFDTNPDLVESLASSWPNVALASLLSSIQGLQVRLNRPESSPPLSGSSVYPNS